MKRYNLVKRKHQSRTRSVTLANFQQAYFLPFWFTCLLVMLLVSVVWFPPLSDEHNGYRAFLHLLLDQFLGELLPIAITLDHNYALHRDDIIARFACRAVMHGAKQYADACGKFIKTHHCVMTLHAVIQNGIFRKHGSYMYGQCERAVHSDLIAVIRKCPMHALKQREHRPNGILIRN